MNAILNPAESEGCRHTWVCICADRNDALWKCMRCSLWGDGFGSTWRPAPPPKTEGEK